MLIESPPARTASLAPGQIAAALSSQPGADLLLDLIEEFYEELLATLGRIAQQAPAKRDKLQALRHTRTPIDRRLGTATLWLDTAGAGGPSPPLRIRFLPQNEARALCDRLANSLARKRLRW